MQLPSALSLDTVIAASLLLGGIYGVLAGKQRLRIFILSIYVGIVLAGQLTDSVSPLVPSVSYEIMSYILLGLPILIFGFFGVMHAKHHAKGAFIANIIVGIVAAALIVSCVLKLLPTSMLTDVNNNSFIALNIARIHPYLLGLLPVVALILGFMRSESKH